MELRYVLAGFVLALWDASVTFCFSRNKISRTVGIVASARVLCRGQGLGKFTSSTATSNAIKGEVMMFIDTLARVRIQVILVRSYPGKYGIDSLRRGRVAL